MSTAAGDALHDFIRNQLPAAELPGGWRVQMGAWRDGSKTARYCVIRLAGGVPVELVREPQFTVSMIGAEGESMSVPGAAADALIQAMRAAGADTLLVLLQPSEPSYFPTADGRHVFEFAVSATTN